MSADPKDLPTIKDVIQTYDLAPKKSLGQNFLFDISLTEKIAKFASVEEGDYLLEIGPGPGALTRALLETKAEKVIAIEKDERAFKALELLINAYGAKLKPILGDAVKEDLVEICENRQVKLIANLPYNISTVLLVKWLSMKDRFISFTLMFQKEVADRLVAKPRTKAYGRLSVLTQWICDVQKCFDISPKAFYPPPKITSTVVHFIPKKDLDFSVDEFKMMENLTMLAFGQRRKMLRQSLKSLDKDIEALLEKVGINPKARAEELDFEDFVRLKDYILKDDEVIRG